MKMPESSQIEKGEQKDVGKIKRIVEEKVDANDEGIERPIFDLCCKDNVANENKYDKRQISYKCRQQYEKEMIWNQQMLINQTKVSLNLFTVISNEYHKEGKIKDIA